MLLASWRVNNEPFDWWLQGFPILVILATLVHGAWDARRRVERDVLPRKRRLEALLAQLKEPDRIL